MINEIILAASSSTSFGTVAAAFLGAFGAVAAAGAAYYPIYRRRSEEARKRAQRMDETSDAVLGRIADPNTGRERFTPGLVHLIPLGDNRIHGVVTLKDTLDEIQESVASKCEGIQMAVKGNTQQIKHTADAVDEIRRRSTNDERRTDERFTDIYRRLG